MHICYMRMLLHAHISEMSSYQQFQFQLIPTLSPIPYCLQVPSSLVRSWAIHINTFIHLFNANTHLKLFSELLCQYHYEKHTKIFQIFFFFAFLPHFLSKTEHLQQNSSIVPWIFFSFFPSSLWLFYSSEMQLGSFILFCFQFQGFPHLHVLLIQICF